MINGSRVEIIHIIVCTKINNILSQSWLIVNTIFRYDTTIYQLSPERERERNIENKRETMK